MGLFYYLFVGRRLVEHLYISLQFIICRGDYFGIKTLLFSAAAIAFNQLSSLSVLCYVWLNYSCLCQFLSGCWCLQGDRVPSSCSQQLQACLCGVKRSIGDSPCWLVLSLLGIVGSSRRLIQLYSYLSFPISVRVVVLRQYRVGIICVETSFIQSSLPPSFVYCVFFVLFH